ncbi:MFS transporter [Alicyclobacillus tolerans]|uniref:MFS transporter n=1 Tax=Alicyclobacillus tolerans TaxID=90970 RepID=UPI001F02515A|nr:MFS transporter [Alicyclobacillus tolerans]MCF8563182.1 MFS transporter [Alicyclobacillus tolerans]
MFKPFTASGFPARVSPIPYLSLAFLSQTGMSFVQQGLVVLGTFFAIQYHLNLTQLGFVTSALSFGVMVSMVFIGLTVDRLGPRVVLFWGAFLMSGLCFLLTQVNLFGTLLIVLFLAGAALAIVPAAGTKAVFTAFAGRPRGLVMGIRQTGVPIGAALSAWLLPQMASHTGLRPVYYIFVCELLLTSWAFVAVMQPWNRVSAAAERVKLRRTDWLKLLRPLSVAVLMVSGQYILLTYTISDLHQGHHLTLVTAGEVLALSQIGGGLGRIGLGQLSDYLGGRRPPAIALAAALGTTFAFIVGVLPARVPVVVLFIIWFILGFAAAGWNALVLTWAGESVPPSHSGLAMSLAGSTVFLGATIFPPLFGFVVDTSHRLAFGWWFLSAVLAIAAGVAWRSARSLSKSP